ncbi:hypothetical protein HK405_015417, partial [Cladochytrium tenue]
PLAAEIAALRADTELHQKDALIAYLRHEIANLRRGPGPGRPSTSQDSSAADRVICLPPDASAADMVEAAYPDPSASRAPKNTDKDRVYPTGSRVLFIAPFRTVMALSTAPAPIFSLLG